MQLKVNSLTQNSKLTGHAKVRRRPRLVSHISQRRFTSETPSETFNVHTKRLERLPKDPMYVDACNCRIIGTAWNVRRYYRPSPHSAGGVVQISTPHRSSDLIDPPPEGPALACTAPRARRRRRRRPPENPRPPNPPTFGRHRFRKTYRRRLRLASNYGRGRRSCPTRRPPRKATELFLKCQKPAFLEASKWIKSMPFAAARRIFCHGH